MTEFFQTPAGMATGAFGAIFALIGLVVVGNRLYRHLKYKIQGYPHEDIIEAALLPYLHHGIMAAYRASERFMDAVGERLRGADKARVAKLVYQYLPDTVTLVGVAWRWKEHVSEERFSGWLQKRFDQFAGWWDEAEQGVLDAIKPEGNEAMITPVYRVGPPLAEESRIPPPVKLRDVEE